MEEDIKILKKANNVLMGKDTGIKLDFEATAQAIENILNRLEQLEKENEECKLDVQDYLKQAQENAEIYRKAQEKIQDLKEEREDILKEADKMFREAQDSIPKFAIKKKIKELESYKGLVMYEKYNYESTILNLEEILGDE